jgi:hypothetical protein
MLRRRRGKTTKNNREWIRLRKAYGATGCESTRTKVFNRRWTQIYADKKRDQISAIRDKVANTINIDLNLVEWRVRLFICVYLRSSAVEGFYSCKFASIRGLSS